MELVINSQRHFAIVVPLTALKTRDITGLTDRKFLSIAQSFYNWLFIYHFVRLLFINNVQIISQKITK